MTLRKKAIVSITITSLLLIAVVLLLSKQVILGSFGRLEEQNIRQNAQQTVSMLEIDLDKFKAVNDTFGHDVGDQLLEMVAKRIRSQLRTTDVVARMGGDEFTILLTNPEHCSADVVVERIGKALAQSFDIKGQTIDFVSASIGLKRYPSDAETTEALVKAADRDMYRVKNQRKHSSIRALIKEVQQAKAV